MVLRLPYPPSVNNYFCEFSRDGRTYKVVGPAGKEYRKEVLLAFRETFSRSRLWEKLYGKIFPLAGRLFFSAELVLPDNRTRDMDNPVKPLWDALTHAGVWQDDSQIDHYQITRLHVEPPGCCDLVIYEYSPK